MVVGVFVVQQRLATRGHRETEHSPHTWGVYQWYEAIWGKWQLATPVIVLHTSVCFFTGVRLLAAPAVHQTKPTTIANIAIFARS